MELLQELNFNFYNRLDLKGFNLADKIISHKAFNDLLQFNCKLSIYDENPDETSYGRFINSNNSSKNVGEIILYKNHLNSNIIFHECGHAAFEALRRRYNRIIFIRSKKIEECFLCMMDGLGQDIINSIEFEYDYFNKKKTMPTSYSDNFGDYISLIFENENGSEISKKYMCKILQYKYHSEYFPNGKNTIPIDPNTNQELKNYSLFK
jgi:hypothetical protein